MGLACLSITGCAKGADKTAEADLTDGITENDTEISSESQETKPEKGIEEMEEIFKNIELAKAVKPLTDHNPVMTQRVGADPYALVYDGRVYLYMTGDDPMYEADGSLKENNYSNIYTINVISSADLVN